MNHIRPTDQPDQPGGLVLPFPGQPSPPQPAQPDTQGTALQPASPVLEGEVIDPDEYARRRRLPVVRAHATVVRLAGSPRAAQAARTTARAGVTIGAGFGSWARRGWDQATHGALKRAIRAAEAAGDREALAEWSDRLIIARRERHQQIMDLPKVAVGLGLVCGICLVATPVLLSLIGLVLQVAGAGSFLGLWHGVFAAVRWVAAVIPVIALVLVVVVPAAVVGAAWREGRRSMTAPRWLLTEDEQAEHDSEISPDLLTAALQHCKIPALTKYLAGGGRLEFVVQPREQGGGTYTQIRLPLGVMAAELLTSVKVELLAGNLGRHRHETWPQRQPEADARVLDLWVADKGAMDRPAPPWPLLFDGEFDVFRDRLPWGVTMRAEPIEVGMLQKHWLIGATSKQGKTTAVRLLVLGLALDVSVELHIADLKGDGDWTMFKPRAATLIEGSTDEDAEATCDMLEWAVKEMARRYDAKRAAGIVGPIPRQISRLPDSGFHPVWVIVDECQVLYAAPHPIGGTKDDARAWRAAKRLHDQARAVNIHLVQATQRPDDRTLPARVREGAHVRGALNVPNYEAAKMILADAADRGARPQDLRPGADAGTVVVTGEVEDIPKGQAFIIARTHYVTTKDAYAVIERAMELLRQAGRTVTGPAEPEPDRDLLADLDRVLGEEHVKAADACGMLRGLAPEPYRKMTRDALVARLAELGVKVPTTNNRYPIDPATVHEALDRRRSAAGDGEE